MSHSWIHLLKFLGSPIQKQNLFISLKCMTGMIEAPPGLGWCSESELGVGWVHGSG